jgi:hypothetical protein
MFLLIIGIITVQYCEDELGFIKLVARPQIPCTDNDHSSNDEDKSVTTDQQSIDNNSRKSVQLVFEIVVLILKTKSFYSIDYVVRKMDISIIPIIWVMMLLIMNKDR